jgi:hypothetical protein
MARRFRMQRTKGWTLPPNGKFVARPSRFGNPFRLPAEALRSQDSYTTVVARYREWITSTDQSKLLAEARRELRGFDLGCFCAPGLPCHVDVLLDLVNQD